MNKMFLSFVFVAVFTVSVQGLQLKSFDFQSLSASGDALLHFLQEQNGIFAIRDIPFYATTRQTYFTESSKCLQAHKQTVQSKHMADSRTTRYTISTNDGTHCGADYEKAKSAFAAVVQKAIHKFTAALDGKQEAFTSTVDESLQLDHFHTYEQPIADGINHQMTLRMHTDLGLFIAMSAPESDQIGGESGFYISSKTGKSQQVDLKKDELVVMIGEAFERKFPHLAVKAVVHGMKMPIGQHRRSWFGRMVVFEEFNQHTIEQFSNRTTRFLMNEDTDFNAVACGNRQLLASNTACVFQKSCSLKPGSSATVENCKKWCNLSGHGGPENCAQHCTCSQSRPGQVCWMLCSENCPTNAQKCSGQKSCVTNFF